MRAFVKLCFGLSLLALGGCGGGGRGQGAPTIPGSPTDLSGIGTSRHWFESGTHYFIGWLPPTDNGGAPVNYKLLAGTSSNGSTFELAKLHGTRAVLKPIYREPVDGRGFGYTAEVRIVAENRAGTSAQAGPISLEYPSYPNNQVDWPGVVRIEGITTSNGNTDATVLRSGWMAYISHALYEDAQSAVVHDTELRLARRQEPYQHTYAYVATIATAQEATLADPDPAMPLCGAAICSGRWVYRAPWLIDDATDPNPARRFKLYAHKHFQQADDELGEWSGRGIIVGWTAATAEGAWSTETPVLAWQRTPAELSSDAPSANALHADLASCTQLAEGSASVRGSVIDYVFTCVADDAFPTRGRIVMLRSRDHGATFRYVSTVLQAFESGTTGRYYSSPSLLAEPGVTPILITTRHDPARPELDQCVLFAFADDEAGTLFADDSLQPYIVRETWPILKAISRYVAGSCAGVNGIYLSYYEPGYNNPDPRVRRYGMLVMGRSM